MIERKTALQNIAAKGKVEVSVLEQELTEIISQMPESPQREGLALRELNNRYSGPDDKTEKYDICIVGSRNLTDFNKKTIEGAKKAYIDNPETALETGVVKIIDGEPVAIDLKETFGKENYKNSNFGKPLGHSWNRNVLALIIPDGATEPVLQEIELRDDFARATMPEMYVTVKCNLLGDLNTKLKTAKSTKFNPSEKNIDYKTVVPSLAQDKIYMLGDCFDEAQKHAKGDEGFYQRYVISSGECRFMNEPKKEGGVYSGTFDDFTTDKMVQAFVEPVAGKPEIGQEYTLLVQTSVKKEYNKDTKQNDGPLQLIMNVMGFWQS